MWCFMSFKLLGSYTNYFQVVPLINFSKLIKRRWSIKSLSCWVRNNMETYSMKMTKFHKSGKWRNNKLIYNTFIKVNLCTWIPFCCFPSKTKLINLFSFLWNTLLNWNIKAMTLKKLEGLLMKIVLFINYYFSKKLACVSLGHKDLKNYLLVKVNIKNLWIHLQTIKISLA